MLIINLRKSEGLGNTFLQVLEGHAEDLQKQDSLLMLASMPPVVVPSWRRRACYDGSVVRKGGEWKICR